MIKLIFFIALYVLFISTATHAACTPSGTTGDDIVNCTGTVNGWQQFYGGNDNISLQNVTGNASYALDDANGITTGTDGQDKFYATNSHFELVLGFGKDDYFEINSSIFSNLYADTYYTWVQQRGDDTIIIRNSISDGWILGGNDNDTIEIYDSNVSQVVAGYSDVYNNFIYTPHDGNDTILLDHVNCTTPNYYYPTIPSSIATGNGDDTIEMIHGGEAFIVLGAYGNDTIIIRDGEHFNSCDYNDENNLARKCGIYGDIEYVLEHSIPHDDNYMSIHHGDDQIILKDADIRDIVVDGGHGSDIITIHTPVQLSGTLLDGGDDKSIADTFIDQLYFEQWSGDIEGKKLRNWEQIILHDISNITLTDNNMSVGSDNGIDAVSNLPYGLIVEDNSILNIKHSYLIDGNLHNSATINMQDGGVPGEIVTISHDYTSNNGVLYLDVTLDDASPNITDRVVIHGDTQGTTTLYINNINGLGGQTPTGDNEGILLIEVAGNSNAVFQLSNTLHIGKYTYTLHKGSSGNWYLQSQKDLAAIKLVKTVDKTTITKPEMLDYTIVLTNAGNIALNSVEVTDTRPDGSLQTLILQSGDNNHNQKLDLNEKWLYTTTYIVTQEDIDKGITVTNKAKVTTSDGASALGYAYTQIKQHNNYSFTKKTTSNPQCVGDQLFYTFTVKNLGNTRLKVSKITDDNCKSTIKLKSESSQQNQILDLNEEQVYTCTSLPVTVFEAKVCKVINVANIAIKTNLSNTELKEKTSKVTTPINIPDPCPCETTILERSPLMPSDSNVPSLSSTSATIQWKDNAFNEIGFKIYRDNILVGATQKDKTSFSINNLQPRTTYTYIIKSYNKYGISYRTIITFTTKDDYTWLPTIYSLFL